MKKLFNKNDKIYIKIIKITKKFFYNKSIVKYYNFNLLRCVYFAKKNLNFISYNQIFLFFSSCNLNDIKKIILIIKKFNIKIYKNFPSRNFYFLNHTKLNLFYKKSVEKKRGVKKKFYLKNLYYNKVNNLKKMNRNIINLNFKKIDFILKKINNFFLKNIKNFYNILGFKKIKNIIKKKISNDTEIVKNNILNFSYSEQNEVNFLKNDFFNKENDFEENIKPIFFETNFENFIKNIRNDKKKIKNNFSIRYFFKLFFSKKIDKYKKNVFLKDFLYKLFIKNEIFNFRLDLNILNKIFNKLQEIFKVINNIKTKIYDIVPNLSTISTINFDFFFYKNGSNLNWVYNISNLIGYNKDFKIKYKKFLKKQGKKIKNIETKNKIKIKNFIKIYSYLQSNKFKIDIIKEKIINSNLYLVNILSKKYLEKDLYLDYLQEGNLGLIKAINNYDYKTGSKFKQFAIKCIKRNINNFFYKSGRLIKLPSYIITINKKINILIDDFVSQHNYIPTISYISEKLNVSESKVKKALGIYKDTISIEKLVGDDSETKLVDLVEDVKSKTPDRLLFEHELKICLDNLLYDVDIKSINVIYMRFGLDGNKRHTLSEIGKKYNVSRERIRQVQNFVLSKLRHPARLKHLKKFFISKGKKKKQGL